MKPVARRRRWLNKRKRRRSLARPRPVRVMAGNAASVSEPTRTVKRIIERTVAQADRYGVDAIGLCEAEDVNCAWFPPGWRIRQGRDDDRAKTLLAVRAERVDILDLTHVLLHPAQHGIGRRYAKDARLRIDADTPRRWGLSTVVFHGPPKRAWIMWAGVMRKLRALKADLYLGDANKLARATAVALGRRVHGHHVMAIGVKRKIPSRLITRVDTGSDHLFPIVELWPNPKRK